MSGQNSAVPYVERLDRRSRWPSGLLVAMLAVLVGVTTASSLKNPDESARRTGEPFASVAGAAVLHDSDLQPAPTSELSVVRISVTTCGFRSVGSGFVIDEGLIITAAHVVGDAHLVSVGQGSTIATGEVLGRFADDRDLALIAVDVRGGPPTRAATIPDVGEPVTIVGHPFDGPLTITVGPLVDLAPQVAKQVGGEVIGVAVSTGLGFSGGPAVDHLGRVVGVVVAAESATDTAIVVRLSWFDQIEDQPLVTGSCQEAD